MNNNIDLQHVIDRHYDNIFSLIHIVNDSSSLINRMLTQNINNMRNNQQNYNYNRTQNYNNQNTRFTYLPRRHNRSNYNNMNESFVNNTTYTFNDNNTQPSNNTQNDNNFVLRFDTLIPFLFDNITNNTNRTDISYNYNIGYVTETNKDDISNISCSYELLDIENYEYISNPTNDICPITRERFNNNQNVMMITSCKHIFNKSSLNRWITNNNTCPNCRSAIKQNINNTDDNEY